MKKFFLLVFVFFTITNVFSEEPTNEMSLGLVSTFNSLTGNNYSLLSSSLGMALSSRPVDHGFFGITSIGLPIFLSANGSVLQSASGLSNDTYLGYAKSIRFKIIEDWPDSLFSFGGGLHYNFIFITDPTGSIYFYNLGPGVYIMTGNETSPLRCRIGFHYDFFSYGMATTIIGDAVFNDANNIGGIISLEIAL